MMTAYKLRTGDFFSDIAKVPRMLLKGKLSLVPYTSREKKKVQDIFMRAKEEEKKR